MAMSVMCSSTVRPRVIVSAQVVALPLIFGASGRALWNPGPDLSPPLQAPKAQAKAMVAPRKNLALMLAGTAAAASLLLAPASQAVDLAGGEEVFNNNCGTLLHSPWISLSRS